MKDLDTALIPRCLPDELLSEIFSRTDPYTLGRAACVCRQWRDVVHNPVFWRNACLNAWQISGNAENDRILQLKYDGSWRKMWISRPRVRTDGLYVSWKTYVLAGAAELKITNPVRVICYYSYIRFHPSGSFLFKDSSQKVKDVARCMNFKASKADCVFRGHYTLLEDLVEGSIFYPGPRPAMQRIRLSLRGTTPGANNRMDLIALVPSGVDHNEANALTPFIFVPFEEVETSFLNLPVERVDHFLPGVKNLEDLFIQTVDNTIRSTDIAKIC